MGAEQPLTTTTLRVLREACNPTMAITPGGRVRLHRVFELGKVYRRRSIHEDLGGQRQGGIITPSSHPVILLVTADAGLDYGYNDEQREDGTFIYYGEGQRGNMEFARGNLAIRDHANTGRDLHLFRKVPTAHLRYLGQFVYAGYELVPDVPDIDQAPRTAIAFQLVPIDADSADDADADAAIAGLSLTELRRAALTPPGEQLPGEAKRRTYRRSAAVRRYVLARADGTCEGCRAPAPFITIAGAPYLEPHHTRRVSDGGPDHPAAVIALCPTCHRRVHHAADSATYNTELTHFLLRIEGTP